MSYPKVWGLGHPNIRELFDGPVVVQEKVDGSQFSFGVLGGALHLRSKGATIYPETTDKLFRAAVDTVMGLFHDGLLEEGWVYRGEAMCGPKHNALKYDRAPVGGVILFDVDVGHEDRIDRRRLVDVADRLGLESVPVFYEGEVRGKGELEDLLGRESCLGGKMEGVVVKNYGRWGSDGKMLMGKVVSEAFKEVNKSNWKKTNPGRKDVVDRLIEAYRTEARWAKAVQHLRERGELQDAPQDIGKLIREVGVDVLEECRAEIEKELFDSLWKDIQRGITRGLPEWWKGELAEKQFAEVV